MEEKDILQVLFSQDEVINKKLDSLHELIHPAQARLILLESDVKSLKHDVGEVKRFNAQIKVEETKSRWHILVVLVVSVLGWLTAVLSKLLDSEWLNTAFKMLSKGG